MKKSRKKLAETNEVIPPATAPQPSKLSDHFSELARVAPEPDIKLPAPKYDPFMAGFSRRKTKAGISRRV